MDLISLGEYYSFKVKEINNIYIKSKYDEWYIEKKHGYFNLYHKNKKHNKDNYHLQTKYKFSSYEEVFKRIHKHDKHVIKERYNKKPSKIERLFKQIACTI